MIALAVVLRPADEITPADPGPHVAQTDNPLQTRHGEIRTYNLSDGSKVTLDADSRVEVTMSEAERRLRLRQGKARFAVAADPVDAGFPQAAVAALQQVSGGLIRAVGP